LKLTKDQKIPVCRKGGYMHPLPHTPPRRSYKIVKHRENFPGGKAAENSPNNTGVKKATIYASTHLYAFME
jgi:hypothetical protein